MYVIGGVHAQLNYVVYLLNVTVMRIDPDRDILGGECFHFKAINEACDSLYHKENYGIYNKR